jgi:transposase
MKPFSKDVEDRVVFHLLEGQSLRKVASLLGMSHTAVRRIRLKRGLDLEKKRGGRPRCLFERSESEIVRLIRIGAVDTATDVANWYSQSSSILVTAQTICCVLHRENLHSTKKIKKPLLTKAHRRARLKFALEHRNWTMQDWHRIVWYDETKINRFGSDGYESLKLHSGFTGD